MAEQERLTNRERRERAREERKRKEAEAAKRAKQNAIRGYAITAVIVALVGMVVYQAVGGGAPTLDGAILISTDEAEAAREAAGCVVLANREPLPERFHFESNAQPPADQIYTGPRPTHSGPHNVTQVQVAQDGFSSQVDERTTTHNLEHGSVIVWYDPDAASDQEREITAWVSLLNRSGFQEPMGFLAGAGIFRSPYSEPGISSGKAIAFRAWGTAMDCDRFDETVANAFVAENFGIRGIGPEGNLGGYPDGVLEFSDREVGEGERDDTPLQPNLEGDILDHDPGTD